MPEFIDSQRQKWTVTITGGTIKRVLDKLKVDLGDPLKGDPPLLTRFDIDIAFKVDLLYVVCLPEAEKRDISDVDFAERLEGDALYHASEALTEAWADFFRCLRRVDLVAAIEKEREQIRKIWNAGEELVTSEAMERTLTKRIKRERDKVLKSWQEEEDEGDAPEDPAALAQPAPAEPGSSSANSLRSPEPTPNPEPSEN